MMHPRGRRLFAAAFCLTGLLIFTCLGFVAVDLSTTAYGSRQMSSLLTLEDRLSLSSLPRRLAEGASQAAAAFTPWERAAADCLSWLLPRWLRLAGAGALLALSP